MGDPARPTEELPKGISTFDRPVEEAAAVLAEKEHSTAQDRRRYVDIVSEAADKATARILEQYGILPAKR